MAQIYEQMKELASNHGTIEKHIKLHNEWFDIGNRLKYNYGRNYYLVSDGEERIDQLINYQGSLQTSGLSGMLWLFPENKILERKIISLEAEDYK
jgi:hypothetical protein